MKMQIILKKVSTALLLASIALPGTVLSASGNYSSDFDFKPIMQMLEHEQFLDAIDELHFELDNDPDNADILSLLGYSYRKTQNYEDAMTFYEWALHAKPNHLGANTYLGELYLETHRLDKAEQQLEVLSDICSSNCKEFETLQKAIDTYKQQASN
ncbi:MAG: tetratricopeptide (TPR) repeat protein [Gammaproteobacteria bacterium]|jgi:tetratricopeptide (TPR) repeat protein